MVGLENFLLQVQNIVKEDPRYELGGDGSDGTCDCIGLIIGAIRRAGGKWTGTHGSNYAARNEMQTLIRQVDVSQLRPGWAVFKAREPGASGYSLPSRQDDSPDRLDYYHAGVVTNITPLEITHCTSGGGANGIVIDTKQGAWLYGGPLSKVDYGEGEGEIVALTATVTAPSGSTVKMRATPSSREKLYWEVPVGSVVNVVTKGGEWSKISWGGNTGQMMTKFLIFDGAETTVTPDGADDHILISMPEGVASALMEALRNAGVS